jgi:hypothetical protein
MAAHSTTEPFPLFIDAAPAGAANYFSDISSYMSSLQRIQQPASSWFPVSASRAAVVPMDKLSDAVLLRYYQYEVTLGLYMLNPREKVIMNAIVLALVTAVSFAVYWAMQPFAVGLVCMLVALVTGGDAAVVDAACGT